MIFWDKNRDRSITVGGKMLKGDLLFTAHPEGVILSKEQVDKLIDHLSKITTKENFRIVCEREEKGVTK